MAFDAGTIEATLTLNRNPFTAGLAAARSQARGFEREKFNAKVGVEVDESQLLNAQARLKSFAEKNVRAVARVMVERLHFDALVRDLKKFDNSRYTANVDVDTGGALAQIAALEAAMRGIRDRTVDLNGSMRSFGNAAEDGFGRGASRFQRMAAIIIATSPLIATALSAVVGVLGALISAVAIAGVGMAAGIGVAIPVFMEVKKAVAGGQEAIDKLPPSIRNAAMAMQEMNKTYFDLVEANKARVGEVMAGGFEIATQVLKTLQPVLTATAEGFKRMNSFAKEFFNGTDYKEYVAFLSDSMAPTMERLTQIVFYFFAAFGNLTEAFYRFGGSKILDMIVDGMEEFALWTDKLGQNQTFLRWMESMQRSIPAVGAFIRDLLEWVINLTIGLEPLGTMIARFFSAVFDGLNSLPPQLMAGITVGFLSMWAAIALGATGPAGLAIGVITGLAIVLADLITRNEEVRKSVTDVVDAIEQRFTPMWNTMASNIRTFVIPAWNELVRVYSENLLPVVERLAQQFNDHVVPVLERIGDTLTGTLIPAFLNFLTAIEPFVTFVVEEVGGAAVKAIEELLEVFDYTLKEIAVIFDIWSAVFRGDWDAAWEGVKTSYELKLGLMETLFGDMWADFLETMRQEGGEIQRGWEELWLGFETTMAGEGLENRIAWEQLWKDLTTTLSEEKQIWIDIWVGFWGGVKTEQDGSQARVTGSWNDFWNGVSGTMDTWIRLLRQWWADFWLNVSLTMDTWIATIRMNWQNFWDGIAAILDTWILNIRTSWETFWLNVSTIMDGWINTIRTNWTTFWNDIGAGLRQWWADVVAGWNGFWATITAGTDQAVNGLRVAWSRIMDTFRNPINWVIQVVLNDGILNAWNTVMGWIGQPGLTVGRIPELASGATAKFATGGPVKGGVPNKDSVRAWLMPGEFVLSKRAVENMGGVNTVQQIHESARGGRLNGLGVGRRDGLARQHLMRAIPADEANGRRYAYGGVQPHVAAAGQEIERIFGRMPGGIGGVGARANASDHPSGHALDFMTMSNVGLGNRVAAHLQANAARMMVKYLIWQQKINQGGGWVGMEDRGSPTANHMDHVHASFLRAGQTGVGMGGAAPEPVSWWSILSGPVTALLNGLMPGSIPGLGGPVGAAALNIPKAAIAKTLEALKAKLEALFTFQGQPGAMGSIASGPVVEQVRAVARRYGWDSGAQWNALYALIEKESSWDPNAANPTSSARGLFQKMTSIHGPVEGTPTGQAEWGLNYIRSRYGTPSGAWAHHQANNWYKNGGWLMPGENAYNETREPEAIFNRPQISAIDRAISENRDGSGGKTHGIDNDLIRAIVQELVSELGGDTINVMLPERATVRELANEIGYRKRVSTKGRYCAR